jgi:hypothetical protein
VKVQTVFFWATACYILEICYPRFGGTCYLHLQGNLYFYDPDDQKLFTYQSAQPGSWVNLKRNKNAVKRLSSDPDNATRRLPY